MDNHKNYRILFFFFIFAFLPGVVFGEEKEEDIGAIMVEAVGVGPGVAPARKAAIDDALKQAVEQSRGVMVKSENLVKDFTTVRDEILREQKALAGPSTASWENAKNPISVSSSQNSFFIVNWY
jgi:hypothetical protein